MPAHRKRTHGRKVAAALVVALAGTGVAFAVQDEPESVSTAGEPAPRSSYSPAPPPPATPTAIPTSTPTTATPTPTPTSAAPTQAATPTPTRKSSTAAARNGTRATSPAPTRTRDSQPTGSVILRETNAARAEAGLPALAENACLAKLAQQHAERLAAEDRLYHQDLQVVLGKCGLRTAGENAAMNYTGAADMVDQWLDSPGHRENLLNRDFTLIGIGVAQAKSGAWYGVQVFGG